MIQYEDDCVGCGLPCDRSCPYYEKQPHYCCANCGDECDPDELYLAENGDALCGDCILKTLPKAYE